jgi:transcriptional regulator with XRE-family HTH domain
MELKSAFSTTLREIRILRNLTQEDFTAVSSRTNLSMLERGKTIPTLEKLEDLCSVLNVHPLTMLAVCYSTKDDISMDSMFGQVVGELEELQRARLDRTPIPET